METLAFINFSKFSLSEQGHMTEHLHESLTLILNIGIETKRIMCHFIDLILKNKPRGDPQTVELSDLQSFHLEGVRNIKRSVRPREALSPGGPL